MYTLFTASLLATVLALLHCAELDFVYDNPCDERGINYQGCHDWTITFNANGGTVSPASVTTGVGDTLGSLPTPARTGYTFKGWYTASTSGTKVTEDRKYNGNTTVYAQWTPIGYTITYDLDGGTVSSANPPSYNIEATAITLRNPTKTGYTFAGWTGTNGMPATTVIIQSGSTGDRSYTANWTINRYMITFNANNGTVTPAFDSTGAGWTLASLPTPSRTDYKFTGWYTSATDGTPITPSTVYSANTVVYAQWKEGFTDVRDGKVYAKVTIGTQTWFAENLNYDVPDNTTDVCYSNNADNCARYGRLYDWGTAMGLEGSYYGTVWGGSDVKHQGVCPVGWHLPSNVEWAQLTDYVGGTSKAGTKLKSSMCWNSYSGVPVGTDEYGFSALPGGYGIADGNFYYAGNSGLWWSATENDANNA
jgi:uncharacterized protein (TIGR02145 family)/uncharacterized repeat protein (TIGR02543 family)